MADTTALSKLGRAWSVIEPEAVGALCIYSIVPNAESGIAFGATFSRQSQKRVCVTRFIRTSNLNLLIAGDSSGLLSVYECKHTCVNTTELTPLCVREIHIKAPFLKLVQSTIDNFYFASIGGDLGLRLFRVDPNDCQVTICSSGRIKKPLAHVKETLTSICLLENNLQVNQLGDIAVNTCGVPAGTSAKPVCRAAIGTSCAQILLYNLAVQPPEWLGTLNLTPLLRKLDSPFADDESAQSYEDIRGSIGAALVAPPTEAKVNVGSAVSHMVICRDGTEHCLAVAVTGYILVLSLRPFLAQDPTSEFTLFEQQYKKRPKSRVIGSVQGSKRCSSAGSSDALISVLACPCETASRARVSAMCWCDEYNLLFCSYQKGVTCWTLKGEVLQCLDMVRWGTVRKLEIQMVPYQGLCLPMLFCATSLGGLRMLDLVEAPNWRLWLPDAGEEGATEPDCRPLVGVDLPSSSVILDEITAVGPDQKEILRAEIYEAFRPARF